MTSLTAEMESYFSREQDIDIPFVLDITSFYGLQESLVIDLSKYVYLTGIIGLCYDKKTDEYVVYEVNENKEIQVDLRTKIEKEACLEILTNLGICFK